MKNVVLILCMVIGMNVHAKVYDFESNDLGWTEVVGNKGEAIIKEGVLYLKGKIEADGDIMAGLVDEWNADHKVVTTCFLPIDVNKPFEIKVDVFAKELEDDEALGLIYNYRDEGNFNMFVLTRSQVSHFRFEKYIEVGRRIDRIKFRKEENVDFVMHFKMLDGIRLIVDGVQVMELQGENDYRYRGIGFVAIGQQVVSFDNLETILK